MECEEGMGDQSMGCVVEHHLGLLVLVVAVTLAILMLPTRVAMRRVEHRRWVVYESPLIRYVHGPAGWTLYLRGIAWVQRILLTILRWLWRWNKQCLQARLRMTIRRWLDLA